MADQPDDVFKGFLDVPPHGAKEVIQNIGKGWPNNNPSGPNQYGGGAHYDKMPDGQLKTAHNGLISALSHVSPGTSSKPITDQLVQSTTEARRRGMEFDDKGRIK